MDIHESGPTGSFKLEVEDFGPIVHASVDLRPLTVFVGPSNTGKSYLAILAYALHRSFGPGRFPGYDRDREHSIIARLSARLQADESGALSLPEWLRQSIENGAPSLVPQHLADGIRPALQQTADLDSFIESEMARSFGVDHCGELIRRAGSQQQAKITLKIPQDIEGTSIPPDDRGHTDAVHYQFEFSRHSGATPTGNLTVGEPLYLREEYIDELSEMARIGRLNAVRLTGRGRVPDSDMERLVSHVVESLHVSLFHTLTSNAFYLPASRTGVMHSHQTVVSALIQSATVAGRRPTARVPVLSGVLADFLDHLLTLGSDPPRERRLLGPWVRRERVRPRKQIQELAKLVEDNILSGSIDQEVGETNYPTFSYRPDGWRNELPLMRTSSMVSELAPVVLYLRHLVRPGDLFIIEEPESHLHPAMQTALARELARLVHAGVRVLLTTHSEWFLEQIGNLVSLSQLPDNRRSGIPGADVALRPDQVGAWLFTPKLRPRGSVVTEIGLERETGLYPAGYDEVSEALYNESAEIFNRLQEATAE